MFFRDKRTLKTCRIYTMLKTHARQKHLSFHTPGHKIGKWDITELSFSDNLSSPRGCIAQAEKEVAQILGAYKSFLLTDGSTCGVLSMLHAAKTLGVKSVAFPETAHKSVWNGCALLGLTPFAFSVEQEGGIPKPTVLKNVENVLVAADAILLTSPDYYGNIPDLFSFRKFCDDTKKLLLIDGAHGGHLHFERDLYAGAHADFWVDGVHKSLPAFTQGAVVSAKYENYAEALNNAVGYFRTTSPSYPIMASVEYAVKFPRNEWLEKEAVALVRSLQNGYFGGDWTKLCVRVENAEEEAKRLEEQGLYPEFAANGVLCFYLSPATKKQEFERLKEYLFALEKRAKIPDKLNPAPLVLHKTDGETEEVDLENAEGRICARACGFFPPCLPFIQKGEIVKRSQIEWLTKAKSTFGLNGRKITVVKE